MCCRFWCRAAALPWHSGKLLLRRDWSYSPDRSCPEPASLQPRLTWNPAPEQDLRDPGDHIQTERCHQGCRLVLLAPHYSACTPQLSGTRVAHEISYVLLYSPPVLMRDRRRPLPDHRKVLFVQRSTSKEARPQIAG